MRTTPATISTRLDLRFRTAKHRMSTNGRATRHPPVRADSLGGRLVPPRVSPSLPGPMAHVDRDVLPVRVLLRGPLCGWRLAVFQRASRSARFRIGGERTAGRPLQYVEPCADGDVLPPLHSSIRGSHAAVVLAGKCRLDRDPRDGLDPES